MKTSEKQILQNGEEQLTLLAGDSLANHSVWTEKEKEQTMTVISGRKCCEQYAKYSHLGSLVKMLLESSRWYSPARKLRWDASSLYSVKKTEKEYLLSRNTLSRQCAETLSVKDIQSNRLLFRLVPSERHTDETGFGLLPTVQTQGMKVCNKNGKTEFIKTDLLPTPMAAEVRHEKRVKELKEAGGETFHSRKNGETRPNGIVDYMDFHGMLPTPMAANYKGSVSPQKIVREDGKIRTDDLKNIPVIVGSHCQQNGGKTSQLSPLFVEEMMGFPSMWIALPFLSASGDKNP